MSENALVNRASRRMDIPVVRLLCSIKLVEISAGRTLPKIIRV